VIILHLIYILLRVLHFKVVVLEAGRSVLSKVLISGGGRCNVMHNPAKPPGEIAKVFAFNSSVLFSFNNEYKRYRAIRGAAKSYWARSVRSSDRTTLTSGSQAAVSSSRQSVTDACFLPRTSKKNCCVYAFVSVNLRLICALLASSSHHHRSSTIADTLEAAARRANVEVVSGAKVIGVDDTERSESIEEVAANLNETKRFTVTYQSSISGAGAAGDDRKGGKVLKGKRSSLYEGLESLSDADVDYQESLEGVDRAAAAATADGTAVTSRREKVTDSIVCDRVIMATGSSRLGYDIVRGLGHSMHDPLPSLFSFKIPVSLCAC